MGPKIVVTAGLLKVLLMLLDLVDLLVVDPAVVEDELNAVFVERVVALVPYLIEQDLVDFERRDLQQVALHLLFLV